MDARRCAGYALLLASALASASCAGATLGQSDEPTVELVVHNESTSPVSAFARAQTDPARVAVSRTQ
jgi:hypothetical protein